MRTNFTILFLFSLFLQVQGQIDLQLSSRNEIVQCGNDFFIENRIELGKHEVDIVKYNEDFEELWSTSFPGRGSASHVVFGVEDVKYLYDVHIGNKRININQIDWEDGYSTHLVLEEKEIKEKIIAIKQDKIKLFKHQNTFVLKNNLCFIYQIDVESAIQYYLITVNNESLDYDIQPIEGLETKFGKLRASSLNIKEYQSRLYYEFIGLNSDYFELCLKNISNTQECYVYRIDSNAQIVEEIVLFIPENIVSNIISGKQSDRFDLNYYDNSTTEIVFSGEKEIVIQLESSCGTIHPFDNHYYYIGKTNGKVRGGDFFICKYDSYGKLIWNKTYTTEYYQILESIDIKRAVLSDKNHTYKVFFVDDHIQLRISMLFEGVSLEISIDKNGDLFNDNIYSSRRISNNSLQPEFPFNIERVDSINELSQNIYNGGVFVTYKYIYSRSKNEVYQLINE